MFLLMQKCLVINSTGPTVSILQAAFPLQTVFSITVTMIESVALWDTLQKLYDMSLAEEKIQNDFIKIFS